LKPACPVTPALSSDVFLALFVARATSVTSSFRAAAITDDFRRAYAALYLFSGSDR
jgi:hypothetical protein